MKQAIIFPAIFMAFFCFGQASAQNRNPEGKTAGRSLRDTVTAKTLSELPADSSIIEPEYYAGAHFGHPAVINISFGVRYGNYICRVSAGTASLIPSLGNIYGFQLDAGYNIYRSKKLMFDLLFPVMYSRGDNFKENDAEIIAFGPAFAYDFFGLHVLGGVSFGKSSYGTWSLRPLLQIGYIFRLGS